MLSLQDAMIIFTSVDKEEMIYQMRAHALNRTLVITMKLADTELVRLYGMDFWMNQYLIDPIKHHHKDPRLYIVWNEKAGFVHQSIQLNPFKSSHFIWMDVGYLRDDRYNGRWVVTDATPFVADKVLMLDVTSITTNFISHLFRKNENRIGGTMFGGTIAAMERYHSEHLKTLSIDIGKSLFVGIDQVEMWRTCQRVENLCHLVVGDRWVSNESPWLYLVPFLLGKLWDPQHTQSEFGRV
jgi:Bacterial protein of unknown function (HtrL_YibB)